MNTLATTTRSLAVSVFLTCFAQATPAEEISLTAGRYDGGRGRSVVIEQVPGSNLVRVVIHYPLSPLNISLRRLGLRLIGSSPSLVRDELTTWFFFDNRLHVVVGSPNFQAQTEASGTSFALVSQNRKGSIVTATFDKPAPGIADDDYRIQLSVDPRTGDLVRLKYRARLAWQLTRNAALLFPYFTCNLVLKALQERSLPDP